MIKDYKYTVSPLILIIQSIESHPDIFSPKALAEYAVKEIEKGFALANWIC